MSGRPVPSRASRPPADRSDADLSPNDQNAAMTGAAVTLTQHIAALTGAVGRNTAALAGERLKQSASLNPNGGGPVKPPAQSPGILGRFASNVTAGLTSFATKIVAPLAPLAVLSQLLGHANSGFGAFISMTKLISTMLAGFLMPAFVMLSGVIYAVATIGSSELMPLFIDLAERGLTAFAGAMERTQQAFNGLEVVLHKFGATVTDLVALLSGITGRKALDAITPGVGGTGGGAFDILGGIGGRETPEAKRRRKFEREGDKNYDLPGLAPGTFEIDAGKGTAEPTQGGIGVGAFKDQVWKGMELALKQIQRDLSPAARNEGIAQAWKSAQMAAFNADPIAQEALMIARKQLEAMMALVAKHRPPTTH